MKKEKEVKKEKTIPTNKNKQVKKKKESYPKGQFWFNVISLILLCGFAIYIGGRSIYFYSKQNAIKKVEEKTLGALLKRSNPIVENGDGLYRVKDEFVFKGKVETNYVSYSNRLWRAMKVQNDNTVRLISEDIQTSLTWGDESNYSSSNIRKWLNLLKEDHTGLFTQSLTQKERYLEQTSWCDGQVEEHKMKCQEEITEDFVTILNLEEYTLIKGKDSYLNNGMYSWLLGKDEENQNLYMNPNGEIKSAPSYETYGVRPIITIKNRIDILSGTGTKEDPYVLEDASTKTKVNQYVKLGEDIWQIYQEEEEMLRLSLNGYLKINGQDQEKIYSDSITEFNLKDRDNIAYFLNNRYLTSLPYRLQLLDCNFYSGDLSDEAGYDYQNMFKTTVNAKVGLLNQMDLKLNRNVTDFYLLSETSSLSEMALVYQSNGLGKEEKADGKKKIVPAICISKDKIIGGTGDLASPYVLE